MTRTIHSPFYSRLVALDREFHAGQRLEAFTHRLAVAAPERMQ